MFVEQAQEDGTKPRRGDMIRSILVSYFLLSWLEILKEIGVRLAILRIPSLWYDTPAGGSRHEDRGSR